MKAVVDNKKNWIDCRISCVKEIFSRNDINLDDFDLFLLGESLDFNFYLVENKGINFPILFGKKTDNEIVISKKLGFSVYKEKCLDFNEQVKNISKYEILINTDRFYLDYLEINKAHFGLHAVNVIDSRCEGSKTEVLLYDCLHFARIWIDIEALNRAMSSKKGLILPENIIYKLAKKREVNVVVSKNLYCNSIIINFEHMLSEKGAFGHMKSFKKFLEFCLVNYSYSTKNTIKLYMRMIEKYITSIDASNSFYRGTLKKALIRACLKYDINLSQNLIEMVSEMERKWCEMANFICEECYVPSKELLNKFNEIMNFEHEFFIMCIDELINNLQL